MNMMRSLLSSFMISAALLSGCLSHHDLSPSTELFQPLAAGKLSDFEQRFTHLTLRGAQGDAMQLGLHWLYTIFCSSTQPKLTFKSPLWEALSLGLELERNRTQSKLLTPLYQPEEGALTARSLPQSTWVTWPLYKGDQEGWPDELPTWLSLKTKCPYEVEDTLKTERMWPLSLLTSSIEPQVLDRLYRLSLLELILNRLKLAFPPNGKSSFLAAPLTITASKAEISQVSRASRVLSTSSVVKDQDQGSPPVILDSSTSKTKDFAKMSEIYPWYWWLLFEKAKLLSEGSQVEYGWLPLGKKLTWLNSLLYAESCLIWKELFRYPTPSTSPEGAWGDFELRATAQVALMHGGCQASIGSYDEALASWEIAVEGGQDQRDPRTLALARYHQLKILNQLNRFAEASRLLSVLPSSRSPLFSPFVYHLGLAMSNMGQSDRLMALSTDVFRDHSWRKDPFLRGLFYLFIRELTHYHFEDRVIELLEDLGPRRELFERVYLFAHVALDEGELDAGSAATQWLLGHDDQASKRPKYHALEARVALLRLDHEGFSQALERISPTKGHLLDAIHQGRRGAFFEHQDEALVELLRSELPKVAGWPSSTRSERKIRLRWLDLIALTLQTFLRYRPETRAYQELIDLYRAARQSLTTKELRAYSEKIGRDHLQSVLIGYVRVRGVDLSSVEPRSYQLAFTSSPALTLLPQSLNPHEWTLTWPSLIISQK